MKRIHNFSEMTYWHELNGLLRRANVSFDSLTPLTAIFNGRISIKHPGNKCRKGFFELSYNYMTSKLEARPVVGACEWFTETIHPNDLPRLSHLSAYLCTFYREFGDMVREYAIYETSNAKSMGGILQWGFQSRLSAPTGTITAIKEASSLVFFHENEKTKGTHLGKIELETPKHITLGSLAQWARANALVLYYQKEHSL